MRFRPHHLVCLHFFDGTGYPEPYLKNLERSMAAFESGGAVVESGADDVCVSCPHLNPDGACTLESEGEAAIRTLDSLAAELLDVKSGDRISYSATRDRIRKALRHWKTYACRDCDWVQTCAPAQRLMAQGD